MATEEFRAAPRWTPLAAIETEGQAQAAARAGMLVAIFLLSGYSLQMVVGFAAGRAHAAVQVWGDLISLAISAFLIWRVWARQALWASILFLLFYLAELASVVVAFGRGAPAGGLLILCLALCLSAAVAIRACWAMRGFRQAPDEPEYL